MIEKTRVIEILRDAFAPLECVPELQNYKHAIGLRIYGPNRIGSITKEFPDASYLRYLNQLESEIVALRERCIEKWGIALAPWAMPVNEE